MMIFNTLDLLVFAFLILSGVFAWRQGLLKQARAVIKWAGIIIGPFYLYLGLEPVIATYVENQNMVRAISVVSGVLVSWLIMSYTTRIWKDKSSHSGVIEQISAVAIGMIRMFFVLYMLWLPINVFWNKDSYPQVLSDSKFEAISIAFSGGIAFILPNQETPQQYLSEVQNLWQNE